MAVGEGLLAQLQGLMACLHEALCGPFVGEGGVPVLQLVSLIERSLLLGAWSSSLVHCIARASPACRHASVNSMSRAHVVQCVSCVNFFDATIAQCGALPAASSLQLISSCGQTRCA